MKKLLLTIALLCSLPAFAAESCWEKSMRTHIDECAERALNQTSPTPEHFLDTFGKCVMSKKPKQKPFANIFNQKKRDAQKNKELFFKDYAELNEKFVIVSKCAEKLGTSLPLIRWDGNNNRYEMVIDHDVFAHETAFKKCAADMARDYRQQKKQN